MVPGKISLFFFFIIINMYKITLIFYFRTYYFSEKEVSNLFQSVGFKVLTCNYVQRRTINFKEKIDVPRIFVQGKFAKF